MDWLTFLATVIKACVWPGAIIGLAFLFRDALRTALPGLAQRISSVKALGSEMTFAEGVAKVEKVLTIETSTIETAPQSAVPASIRHDPETSELNAIGPYRMVLDQWDGLDAMLDQIASRYGAQFGNNTFIDMKLRGVLAVAKADPHTIQAMLDMCLTLLNLKQIAVDNPLIVDSYDASRFANMMIKFRSWILSVTNRSEPPS